MCRPRFLVTILGASTEVVEDVAEEEGAPFGRMTVSEMEMRAEEDEEEEVEAVGLSDMVVLLGVFS